MRLSEKIRSGGKLHRRYDQTATPYRRLLDSGQLSADTQQALQRQYDALSPKKLMQIIQKKQLQLFSIISKSDAHLRRRTQPRSVTSLLTQRPPVRLPR